MLDITHLPLVPKLTPSSSLAQARTGTGKTLAFLIPVLQNIINVDPTLERPTYVNNRRRAPPDIRAIIISPTRELAEQIAVEARKVTRGTGVIVQTAVGGTYKREGLRRIQEQGCHILVGTPGRLEDLLSDPYSRVSAPNLSALVLDEADRLLDQGFSQAIEDIQGHLPRRSDVDRQTLLFSATVPPEVMHMVRRTMKPDFQFVRTVQEGEQETHEKVPQKVSFTTGFDNVMPALVELCKQAQQNLQGKPFKAIVYFGATAEVALAASTFAHLKAPGSDAALGRNPFHPASIIEMHGRLDQIQRTRAADTFRRSESGILISSDVTARGMDFPNVTHVIQVGIPPNREAYVHRIGRTARGDKGGEGWLLLTDFEKSEARQRLRDLPLTLDMSLETARIDMSRDAQLNASAAETLTQTINASKLVHPSLKQDAYLAALGLYNWASSKQRLVASLNARAKYCWAMDTLPPISHGVASRLGLLGLEGIVIGSSRRSESDDDPRSSYGGRTSNHSRDSSRGRTGGRLFGDRDLAGEDGKFGQRTGGGFGGGFGGGERRPGMSGDRGRGGFGDRGGSGYGLKSGFGRGGDQRGRTGDRGGGDRRGGREDRNSWGA